MYITKFEVTNYKSFLASPELNLTPGFNVIVGQNNAGKTTLAEVLSLEFEDKPHRSLRTIPYPNTLYPQVSTANVAFHLDEGEAEELLINTYGGFYVPLRQRESTPEAITEAATSFLTALHNSSILQCIYQRRDFDSAYLESYGWQDNNSPQIQFSVDIAQHRLEYERNSTVIGQRLNYYGLHLARLLRARVYCFKAERLNISNHTFGMQTVLLPNASNLAEVLHNLQGSNPSRFRRFNEYISTIFPEIKWIAVPSGPASNEVQILVWSIEPNTEREDLAIPLSESGTGIGQALAILYVVLTATFPRTIIIDEPQSFLNPGAVRKLIEILKQHPQHQFIITTHSPEIVSITNPKTLFLLRKVDTETVIELLDSTKAQDQLLLLLEVGARLSDVFGADNILWVEGSTEELCFPLIVEKVLRRPLAGTKIMGVLQTGDFEGRHSEAIFQIYKRLSEAGGLIPPAIGFIFDQEGRSRQEQEDLIRRSRGSVIFLPRRMFENYLLNPHAIAHVVSEIEGFRDSQITLDEVENWLQCHHSDRRYYGTPIDESELTSDRWKQHVHGAKLLEDLFKELSELRIYYDKIEHGLALTKWIIENATTDLSELANLIASKLSSTA